MDREGKPLRLAILWLGQRKTHGMKPLGGAWRLLFKIARLSNTISYFQAEAESEGQIKVVRTASEVDACLKNGTIAAVLRMEGAEAIDPELNTLYVFYRAGLRSLGITWSRVNDFAHAVPFKFPHSPDTGPRLSEQGFWDTARISQAPLVVTHAGVHTLCPSTRNLTDKQLDAIGESGGIVGINFHVGFLRADGRLDPDPRSRRLYATYAMSSIESASTTWLLVPILTAPPSPMSSGIGQDFRNSFRP